MEKELKTLPPPTSKQTFKNTGKRRKTITTGHARRKVKNLVQFNVKIPARARDRFNQAFDAITKETGITRGELLEMMIASYIDGGSQALPASLRETINASEPPVIDRDEGRSQRMEFWATPELASVLNKRCSKNEWTLSQTIEHACSIAARAEKARALKPEEA